MNGLEANFNWDERMFDEMRHKTLMKILQLNSKSEVELSTARHELLANIEKTKHETILIARQNSNEIVSKEAATLKNWTEVKIRNMKGDLEGYIQKQIEKGIQKATSVPGLVGEGEPYSTLANYLLQFSHRTKHDIDSVKTQTVVMQSNVDEMMYKTNIFEKEMTLQHNLKVKSDNEHMHEKQMINQQIAVLKLRLEEVLTKANPFSKDELAHLKEIGNDKFTKLAKRVDELIEEVFAEVVDNELTTLGIETRDIDQIEEQLSELPENLQKNTSFTRSLIGRMSTIRNDDTKMMKRMSTLRTKLMERETPMEVPTEIEEASSLTSKGIGTSKSVSLSDISQKKRAEKEAQEEKKKSGKDLREAALGAAE